MKTVPNAAAATIGHRKLVDYLLDGSHPDGASKAAWFRRFGFARSAPDILGAALGRHVRERSVEDRIETVNGVKWIVRCDLVTPDGRNPCIRSVWLDRGDGIPDLLTARPLSRREREASKG
jgi:hypothetical protein